MLRAGIDGAIWLSDNEDEARFYERCAHEKAQVVSAPDVAIPLLDKLEQLGVHGLVATSRGVPPRAAPNIFQPSLGDVASLLLFSKSSGEVIRDICGNAWLLACEREVGPICRRAAWIARVLWHLRRACAQESVHCLDGGDPSETIDWNTFELAWDRLGPILIGSGLSQGALENSRAVRPSKDLAAELIECDGMDAVRTLAAATQVYHPRGIAASRAVEADDLFSMLRVAFDVRDFEEDEVYWRMRLWERANVHYPMLRQWRTLDPLGVVWDQRYWESDLSAMLKILKPGESLAMFKMDLDDFKRVNEALGHGGGDEAIRLYCKIVKKVLGTVCEVYRRGGDEVVALAPGLRELPARELAEQVRAEIEATFRGWSAERGVHPSPTASIGVVLSTAERSHAAIARLADEAQQEAKRQGKNRVVFVQ
jgi:diguanylate cyclase (GGDEF)-like protein